MTPGARIVPANEASWEDLEAVLGGRGYHSGCWCQRFKDETSGPALLLVRRRPVRTKPRAGRAGHPGATFVEICVHLQQPFL